MKPPMRVAALVAIAASSVLTGCASIVNGTNQVLSIEARNKTQPVPGASCKLENGKGVYYVQHPGGAGEGRESLNTSACAAGVGNARRAGQAISAEVRSGSGIGPRYSVVQFFG